MAIRSGLDKDAIRPGTCQVFRQRGSGATCTNWEWLTHNDAELQDVGGLISRNGCLGEVSHFPSPGDGDLHRGVGYRFRLPRHSHGGILKHKSPTPAGAGRGSSAAGREQQGDGMTVEELHDGRGEVLKHTSSALAGERTLLCTLCGMCRLQSNKGSDAHSDFRITVLLLAEGRNCNPTKWRS